MVKYGSILEGIEAEENRNLLRPCPETLRQLARALLDLRRDAGVMPDALSKYFTQIVSNHIIVISSEILLEVRNRRTSIETISTFVNHFLEVFGDTCFHVKRIIEGHLPDSKVYSILVKCVKGDQDECYQLRTLVDEHLAGYIIDILQLLCGKVINAILRYSLMSGTTMEIDNLLDHCLEINIDSPAQNIIECWIAVKELSFDLTSTLDISSHITELQAVLRQTNFFIEAGCKGVVTIPPPPSEADQQARRLRSIYMPIRARVMRRQETKTPMPFLLQTGRRTAIRQTVRGPELPTMRRGSVDSMDSSERDFLEREPEIYSGIKTRQRDFNDYDDDSESEARSGDAFERGRGKNAGALESLVEQIRNLDGGSLQNQLIEPDMMDCINEAWANLSELQG